MVAETTLVDQFTERIFTSIVDALDLASIALGHQLGYYDHLKELGAANSTQLAEIAGANERYTREWLEHQASSGLIDVALPSDSGTDRVYRLVPGSELLFTDCTGEQPILHFVRSAMASILAMPDVAKVFRTGEGLPFGHYGEEMMHGQALGTRWGFMTELGSSWIPALPDIHQRLLNTPGSRVADIGFGMGWSSIAFARAYPNAQVDGFDLDERSVTAARRLATEQGLADRVHFMTRDASDPALSGQYDLAFAFECVHDMANPVGALRAMRNLVGAGGTVLIVDENVPDTFSAPGSETDRLMYGYSIFHCLPGAMDGDNPAGTGTVMRQSTFRQYASDAGYQSVDLLPIENDFFKFYRLTA